MSGSAPSAGWAPGYDVSAPLRQGRRARLLRATKATSGAEVVLKALPPGAGQNELGRLRELNGVPGVVPLLDAGTAADGSVFVVQPYYPDGSFGEMLARKGPAPVQEAAAVARSVAGALGALHGRGLLHNNVCPGNVLRAGRTPVLTGFGSVHEIGVPLPPPPPVMESFLHSPPEALRGEPRTAASDVYQLASTIWTMLVGRAPFSIPGNAPFDPQAYARRTLSEEPDPVSRPDVSRSLRRVLTRALSKAPEERYPSAPEFAAAFEKARSGRPSTSAPAPSDAQTSMRGPATGNVPSGPQPSMLAPLPGTRTAPPSNAQTIPPIEEPRPGSGSPLSGPQTAHPVGPHHQSPGTGSSAPAPVEAHAAPEDGASPEAPERSRLENATRLRPPHRALPTPEEREWHGTAPDETANSTADLMVAKLRGEEISPLRAWSRLEGWTGDTESSYLPVDESEPERSEEPEWEPLRERTPELPRWRRQLHIGVTVCGIFLVTATSSVFAATNTSEPVVAAAAEETEEEPVEEDAPAEPVAEPSAPPEVSAPSDVTLEDTLSAVTLNWVDNTGGTGSYFVVGGAQDHDPRTLARTGPGAVTAQVPTENTQVEYCFTLVAVDQGTAPAEEVCTTRGADRAAEAERQAEEEAEREAEEEEEEEEEEAEASPAPSPSPNADD